MGKYMSPFKTLHSVHHNLAKLFRRQTDGLVWDVTSCRSLVVVGSGGSDSLNYGRRALRLSVYAIPPSPLY